MSERRSEKFGWIGGWFGSFIWVLILSVVQLVEGKRQQATVGLLIFAAACAAVLAFAPWKHPGTKYRLLLLPCYLVFFGALGWGIWSSSAREMGINGWWSLLTLMPALMPLWTVGNRRWKDLAAESAH
jgi:hypothetical protein